MDTTERTARKSTPGIGTSLAPVGREQRRGTRRGPRRLLDPSAVLRQVANEGVLVQEGDGFLPPGGAGQQRAQRLEPIRAMRQRDPTDLVQLVTGVPASEVEQSLEHAHALDAAGLQHRFGPARRLGTDAPDLTDQPGGAALDAA